MIYPLLFRPNLHTVVWGGSRLKPWKHLADDEAPNPVGESWEVSAVESSPSVVANGPFAGRKITDLIEDYPEEILGKAVSEQYGNKLPLLVKFIDADQDLSIQVHPNDEMAMREHGKSGKSEMWYIIDAKPGAYLYAGFKETITPEEYTQRVADGTICDVLARHEVHKGDVFYLPAGRVHAICGGILLAEVQQSSDITYRIFDYNRPGIDGRPRELHTALAAQALDFSVKMEYRTIYDDSPVSVKRCVDCENFSVSLIDVNSIYRRNLMKYDSFVICMAVRGNCSIQIRRTGDIVELHEGFSCLIPALHADYDIVPSEGNTDSVQILESYIDNMDRSFMGKVSRILHVSNK